MSKTAPIPDDAHDLIVDKQTEIKRKYKVTVKISDIIAIIVKNNIHKMEKYLGLGTKDGPEDATNSVTQDIAGDQENTNRDIQNPDIVGDKEIKK